MASFTIYNHPATPALQLIYERFCTFGKGHKVVLQDIRMESRSFIKFCKDTTIISKQLSQTSCDLIFTKVKQKGTRTIDFIGFLSCLEQASHQRGVEFDQLIHHILTIHGILPDGSLSTRATTTPTTPTRATPSTSTPNPPSSPPHPTTAHQSSTVKEAAPPSTMLIVVDMQLDFYSRNEVVSAAFPYLPNRISNLIATCRNSGLVEVVHLREGSNSTDSPWYSFWQQLNPGCDSSADPNLPEDCAADIFHERIFIKYGYDGVGVNSGLVDYINSRSRQNGQPMNVLMCGLVTSCCIHMNAAGLFLRGYPTFVVSDCCGDRTVRMHIETLQREARRSYAVVEMNDVKQLLDAEVSDSEVVRDTLVSVCWPNKTQVEK